jgi:hypothetical protein
MASRGAPFARTGDGTFKVGIPAPFLDVVRRLCEGLRELLLTEDAAGDPAVARLFPAAYDDPLRNLDFERAVGDGLLASRLAGLDTVQATLGADAITEEELLAWLRTINDLRLVLGVRLDVREESTFADFAGDEEAAANFEVYRLLAELESWMLEALDPGLGEDPSWSDPPAPG